MQKMKEKFSKIFSDKSKLKSTFVSIVALVVALVISVSTVSAWVETVSTIKIDGSGKIDTKLVTAANIQHTHADSIDLKKYFRKAGNVHLSEASSVDGKNFFFPVVSSSISSSTGQSKYRKGTVNDENVNYIKFSLNVKSDSKNYGYRLSQVPVIEIGDTTVSKSAVRIAVTDETANNTVIMSMVGTDAQMPGATNGKLFDTDPTVKAFSYYKSHDIFTINKGDTHKITVTLWLQDIAFDKHIVDNGPVSDYTVDVSNFVIVTSTPKVKVSAVAVTNGTEGSTGGTVKVEGATTGTDKVEAEVAEGGSVKFVATENDGYKFVGWFDENGKSKTSNKTLTVSNVTKAQTYYAHFDTAYEVQAISVTNNKESGTGGKVVVGSGTKGATSSDKVASGEETTFVATAESGYAFVGWYTEPTGGAQKSPDTEYTVAITAKTTLYARFVIAYKVTAYAVTNGNKENTDGGTVKITYNGTSTTASGKAEQTVNKGGSVTLTADPVDGCTFEGWFSSETDTSADSSDKDYTIENITSAKTLYARFTKSTKTVYVGVISYEGNQGVNASTLKVHYRNNNGLSNDATVKALNKTYTKHINEWNSNQIFTMYKAELPADATHMKAYAHVNNADRRYGGNYDFVISSGNCLLCYNYSGYRCIQITY